MSRDETSGAVICGPAAYTTGAKDGKAKECEHAVLPWRHWLGESGRAAVAGTTVGDYSTAKAMLQQCHQVNLETVREQGVEILTAYVPKEGVKDFRKVIATVNLKPGDLQLPLCFTNHGRLVTPSEGATNHPYAVTVTVSTHGLTTPVFENHATGPAVRGNKRPGAAVAGKGRGKKVREDAAAEEPKAQQESEEDTSAGEKSKEFTELLETAVAGLPPEKPATRTTTFYALPEWQIPTDGRSAKDKAKNFGVTRAAELTKDMPMSACPRVHSLQQDLWKWSTAGDEAMHPFWAVTRMDEHKLEGAGGRNGQESARTIETAVQCHDRSP